MIEDTSNYSLYDESYIMGGMIEHSTQKGRAAKFLRKQLDTTLSWTRTSIIGLMIAKIQAYSELHLSANSPIKFPSSAKK